MAYITYKFSRPKNAYEKSLDYNQRLTWWLSFITNWFWITDVTDYKNNTRECEKGFNSFIMLSSIALIVCFILKSYYLTDYSIYFSVASYFIILAMIIYPLLKLMAKASFYFLLYYLVFFYFFEFDFGVDYLASSLLVLIYFVGLNIPGIFYNNAYLKAVAAKNNFTLDDIEINYFSLFWLYNKFIKKKTVEQYKKIEIAKYKSLSTEK